MSDNWEVGDLALIVRGGKIKCPNPHFGFHDGVKVPSVGTIGTVVSVRPSVMYCGDYCGCETIDFFDGRSAVTQRARKIRPHTPDAEDAETIALLNGKPVPVPA